MSGSRESTGYPRDKVLFRLHRAQHEKETTKERHKTEYEKQKNRLNCFTRQNGKEIGMIPILASYGLYDHEKNPRI